MRVKNAAFAVRDAQFPEGLPGPYNIQLALNDRGRSNLFECDIHSSFRL